MEGRRERPQRGASLPTAEPAGRPASSQHGHTEVSGEKAMSAASAPGRLRWWPRAVRRHVLRGPRVLVSQPLSQPRPAGQSDSALTVCYRWRGRGCVRYGAAIGTTSRAERRLRTHTATQTAYSRD